MKKQALPEERLLELIKNPPQPEVSAPLPPSPVIPSGTRVKSGSPRPLRLLIPLLGVLLLTLGFTRFHSSPKKNSHESRKPAPGNQPLKVQPASVPDKPQPGSTLPVSKTVSPAALTLIEPPPGVLLLGIINGEHPSAIIQDPESGRHQSLEIGERWKSYTLSQIQKGQVVFTNEREKFILKI